MLAAVFIAGCSLQPPPRPALPADVLESRAETAAEAGQPAQAARLYRELAASARGVQRAGYLLEAARFSLEAGRLDEAASDLDAARRDADDGQTRHLLVLRADLALREERPQDALATLDSVRQPVPVPLSAAMAAIRGQALFRLNQPAEAVAVLMERELWLEQGTDILDNQRLIWDGLAAMGLDRPPQPSGDDIIDGWLALAPIAARAAEDSRAARPALIEWRAANRNHPAAMGLLAALLGEPMAPVEGFPRRIALLLPLGANERPFALAVRDGFMAAHFASSNGAETAIRMYDTAEMGAVEAYRRAQADGNDFIVGPLLRDDVTAVRTESGFVPTLALNNSLEETLYTPRFYQFALAPEDEAREAARHAFAAGARTAVALIPFGDALGDRLLAAFRTEFESLGGHVAGHDRYDQVTGDFSAPITSLLNIRRSNQRRERLAANLNTRLEFEPRLRQDVDVIFMAANAASARLLVPQLRFHDAGHIPAYSTSEVYEPSRVRERDLDGVLFPDAPWLLAPNATAIALRRELESHWPQRTADGFMIRLYAMGYDAYHLAGRLHAGAGFAPVEGMSGELALGGDGRIHRKLPMAQFRSGRPVALEVAAPSATEALGQALR